MGAVNAGPGLPDYTVKTYRYLRLGMVLLVVMLAAAILVEWLSTDPACWQTSISGYYFTPVKGVLVGSLVAIGVAMIVVKGNTETEDVLLNVAGMLAPVVAFVPTPEFVACWSSAPPDRDIPSDIANNVTALLVAGALAVLVVTGVVLHRARHGEADPRHAAGAAASGVLLLGGAIWFALGRGSFDRAAHYAAAVPMFLCFVAVVALNSRDAGPQGEQPGERSRYASAYLLIAATMVGGTALLGLVALVSGWQHALLWIEGLLIAGFAAFWLLQTRELWNQGVRETGRR